jgi:hypothetical protein
MLCATVACYQLQVGLKRDWMPHGLFLVPTLSEKGIKGAFTLEVHSDAPVDVGELPETVSRYSIIVLYSCIHTILMHSYIVLRCVL